MSEFVLAKTKCRYRDNEVEEVCKLYYTGRNTIIENGLHTGNSKDIRDARKFESESAARECLNDLYEMTTFHTGAGYSIERVL